MSPLNVNQPVSLCVEIPIGADDGTPVDEPVWQLREPKEVSSPSGHLSDSANESEEPVSQAMWCGPSGIVATRYLASPTTASDTHIHIFRETTV